MVWRTAFRIVRRQEEPVSFENQPISHESSILPMKLERFIEK
jgi:hypothetical protein